MTMTKAQERDEFIAALVTSLPNIPRHLLIQNAGLLIRHGKSYARIQEMICNGHPAQASNLPATTIRALQDEHDKWCKKREKHLEKRISVICSTMGITPIFNGDPRGSTVKLQLPSGQTNDWGREGWCVPQS